MRAQLAGLVLVVATLGSGSLGACSSFSADPSVVDAGPTDSGGAVDEAAIDSGPPADAAPAIDAAIYEFNPYGKPYPTKYIGWDVRNGDAAGYVIANLKLTGYKVAATKTETIPLAFFYDPEGRTHSTVVMLICASWDTFGKQMLQALSGKLPSRVAFVSVLVQGEDYQKAPTLPELDAWRLRLTSAVHVMDPMFASLKPLSDLTVALPGTVVLDARTMEIVSAGAGAATDPVPTFTAARDAIEARPPAY